MQPKPLTVLSAALFVALSVGCSKSKALTPTVPTSPSTTPASGATLKVTAPSPQSPINDVRLETFDAPTLTAGASTAEHGGSPALQYRFQVFNEAGVVIEESSLRSSSSWVPAVLLEFDKKYSWWVRSEMAGDVGPWSERASFMTPNGGFQRGQEIFDPLTNSQTVGTLYGGHLVPGQGWQALQYTDGLDYTIPTCTACTIEFDVTNFNEGEGGSVLKDVKWISMGDGPAFNDFFSFRNHDWKMHLEQRGDGNGTGMKLIWRNGCGDCGDDEPGDHTQKIDPAIQWEGSKVYHFTITWNPGGFEIWVGETQPDGSLINNKRWFEDGFGGNAYAPPTHRISLGTRTRGETMVTAIWRNFKVYPGGIRRR